MAADGAATASAGIPSDLAIARAADLLPIEEVAARAGIAAEFVEPYGRWVAKIGPGALATLADRRPARYVLITAITPTPLGEGKTTTAVGLAQGLALLGRTATVALRQPSMGPTFGIKGGAAGGGYSQVVPMESMNLHLTGDFHAVTAAHNLLAAMVDNHLHHGNELGLDPRSVTWRRVLDVNDRALRNIVVGLGARIDGVPRQGGFDITAASEVMVILALATSLRDMRERLGRIVVGFTADGRPVTAEDLKAAGAMAVILREAIKPNLLQTLAQTPALVHAGPFGNIATGNSSVVADLLGIRTGDYLITEAGFGADMGAERFFNIKCRVSGLRPDAAVLVATVRALKAHSGRFKVVAGKPLPPEMLAGVPRRCARRARPTCAGTSRSSGGSASHLSWPSTPSPATTTRSTPSSARSPRRPGPGSRSPATSPRGAPARWRSPRRWSRPAPSRRSSATCTTWTRRW